MGVRRDKAALFSGCKPHPAIRSSRKQPEQAWGRRMYEAFGSRSRIGDRASAQAATRVNAEQASHDERSVKGSRHGTSKRLQLLRFGIQGPSPFARRGSFPSTVNLT